MFVCMGLICIEAVAGMGTVYKPESVEFAGSICDGVLFNKILGPQSITLLKMTLSQLFLCKFWESFRKSYSIVHQF